MVFTQKGGLISYRYILFFLIASVLACNHKDANGSSSPFNDALREYAVSDPKLIEVSGIADSKLNPGYLWVQEDSGNPSEIGLLQHDGHYLKTIYLDSCVNRDWEDMVLAAGPKPGINYLYIAETGDNLMVYPNYTIYRLEEPVATIDTVRQVDKIAFFYPDGSHNAEAILVDPDTKDIYIITKTDTKSMLFKLTYPYSTTMKNKAAAVGALPYNFVVSAGLSPTGREVVIKTYDALYYYKREAGESLLQALGKQPVKLGYQVEPQGEAIVFANDDAGFYTLSEKGLASSVKLYFYKRE